jgi:hypothetical protein
MRTLITFILRLWVDPQVEEPAWEGQVECVASGERVHVRGQEELVRFIESHTKPESLSEEVRSDGLGVSSQ